MKDMHESESEIVVIDLLGKTNRNFACRIFFLCFLLCEKKNILH